MRLLRMFRELLSRNSPSRSRRRPLRIRRWRSIIDYVWPTATLIVVALVAMQIHRATLFKIELTVGRVAFKPAEGPAQVTGKILFYDALLHLIQHAELTGGRLLQPDAASRDDNSISRTEDASMRIDQLTGSGADLLFLRPPNNTGAAGFLERLDVPSGAGALISVTTGRPAKLSMTIVDKPGQFGLQFPGEVWFTTMNAEVGGRSLHTDGEGGVTVRSAGAPSVFRAYATGAAYLSTIQLTPMLINPLDQVILQPGMRISELRFPPSSSTGSAVSPIASEGKILVGGSDSGDAIAVQPGDSISLEGLSQFHIQELIFNPEHGGIEIRAEGVARSLRSGPPGDARERTLTWLDYLWKQPWTVRLFVIAAWALTTTNSIRKHIRRQQP